MVVLMLYKNFLNEKAFETREFSDKIRLPKGVIIEISQECEVEGIDDIEWWLEIGGRRFFPYETVKGTHGAISKTYFGSIKEFFPIRSRALDIQLVGFNTSANSRHMRVFVTVIPQKDMPAYLKWK